MAEGETFRTRAATEKSPNKMHLQRHTEPWGSGYQQGAVVLPSSQGKMSSKALLHYLQAPCFFNAFKVNNSLQERNNDVQKIEQNKNQVQISLTVMGRNGELPEQ